MSKDGQIGFGLVGAGEFGATLIAQARRVPALRLKLVCDLDTSRARAALSRAGYADGDCVVCSSRGAILQAVERNHIAVIDDPTILTGLPLQVVVEATGDPEGAALAVEQALSSGYHTIMATKEAEILIGPELARRARAAGLAHLPVEGDQPALLIALVARARLLGLPVVAAGKSTESDYVYDPAAGTLSAWGQTLAVPGYAALLDCGSALPEAISRRLHPDHPVATAPDLCEMGIVANTCGLVPDRPDLHAPVLRPVEVPLMMRLRADGGLLSGTGRVEVFACLRRPDELSFAGGVFAVVEMPNPQTGRLLQSKGLPTSPDGRHLLIHNPVHLLGLEAIASILAAARGPRSDGTAKPRYDLVGRANRAIAPGEVLKLGPRHAIESMDPLLLPAQAVAGPNPLPYYLAAGAQICRPISAGALLTEDDVMIDRSSARYRIRQSQDRAFHMTEGIVDPA